MTVAAPLVCGGNPRVVKEARRWIGTPYQHQASCRSVGCDCLGLIRGIWRALYQSEPEQPPAYSMDWAEPQGEEQLWRAARRHLIAKPLSAAAIGDVLLFRMRAGTVAKHLGVQPQLSCEADAGSCAAVFAGAAFIHAYSGHGVVESAQTRSWQRRIVGRFTFPEEQT
jgi:NlpC/P60 family putative phage cell wall peptidase